MNFPPIEWTGSQHPVKARTKAALTQPGDQVAFNEIATLQTIAPDGLVVILGGTSSGPVKLFAYGDGTSGDGKVTMLASTNGSLTCAQAHSGMILQSPSVKSGTMVINGITIQCE